MTTLVGEMSLPAGVSSYRDRHGRMRWRLRKAGITVSLPGQPGDARFEESLTAAQSGQPIPSTRALRSRARKEVMAETFAAGAIRRAHTRAMEKDVPFSLTRADFIELMARQNWACAISNFPFAVEPPERTRQLDAMRPSLDRVVPSLGYVRGNVRIVCEVVNFAMNNWGPEPLFRIALHMQKANLLANLDGELR